MKGDLVGTSLNFIEVGYCNIVTTYYLTKKDKFIQ